MKLIALFFALLLLSLPQQSFAEQGSDTDTSQGTTEKMELKNTKAQERKAYGMEKKAKLGDAVNENREARLEEIKQKKAAFKEKLEALTDEQKKVIAERLDAKLDKMNKNRTDRMTERITKLSEILSKFEAKKIEAQTNGKDVTAINTAIVAAEQAIATAETAIAAQAGKDYTAQITDESTLKLNFGKVVTLLRSDLAGTQKTVVDAKEAVKLVAKALLLVEEPGETVSPTP